MPLTDCRECGNQVSRQAKTCPSCGARKPARDKPPYTAKEWVLGCAAVAGGLVFVLWTIGRAAPFFEEDPKSDLDGARECRAAVQVRLNNPRYLDWLEESVGPTGDGKHDVMGRVADGSSVVHEYRCILEGEPGDRDVDLQYVRPR